MPATNCARPPNVAANGNRKMPEVVVPNHPAMLAATMKVAPANPNSPRIDGAAIGCRNTRVWFLQALVSSAVKPPLWWRGSAVVLMPVLLSGC
jgi:hypothetical protein